MAIKENKYCKTKPRILFIDMAYTLKMVKERELQQEFNSRICGGYFEHVWGVHPMADVPENRTLEYEGFKPSIFEYSKDQTIIEGQSAYYKTLKNIFPLNFLFSQFRFIKYLISLVRKEHIDIVYVSDPYYTGLIGVLIKWFTKAKLVVWVCANNDEIYKSTGTPAMPRMFKYRWVEKIIERFVFRSVDLTAGVNQNNLQFALNNGASLKKSTIFSNGKLINPLHKTEPQNRDKDIIFQQHPTKYNFIYIGRMTEIKHPDDVVQAFNIICKSNSDCSLIMAGDGPMVEDLKKMAEGMGILDKIRFIGNINQARLANILAGCFAVLSPLTGRSLMEASLAGLPIVAYDRDWQLDFVTKNGNGIIVPFRDWQSMGKEALSLIESPVTAKKYAEASRRTGLDFCNTDRLFMHEQNEYNKILKR